jgi:hypothetical protein
MWIGTAELNGVADLEVGESFREINKNPAIAVTVRYRNAQRYISLGLNTILLT